MSKKQDEAAALLAGLMKQSGYIKCEECSTENWEMHHGPNELCPKKVAMPRISNNSVPPPTGDVESR